MRVLIDIPIGALILEADLPAAQLAVLAEGGRDGHGRSRGRGPALPVDLEAGRRLPGGHC